MLNDREFWFATFERAIKTFAQTLLAVLGASQFGLFDAPWGPALSAAGFAAALSVVASVASSGVGAPGPSLGQETTT